MSDTGFLTRLSHRAVIHITGADARDFLQRVVTNGPQGVTPGKVLGSALLTPQGKVLADFIFLDDGEGGLFVDVPAGEADALLKRFTLYRLRAKAELGLRDDLAVAAARGDAVAALEAAALTMAPDPRGPGLGMRAIVPASANISDDTAGYFAAKAAACVTEMPHDYGPAEVFSTDVNHDLLHMINYKKGCFVGQEVASRMHRKGGVRKRTVYLTGDGAFASGLAVTAGETPLGEILSGGQGFALALLRVDRLEAADQPVTVDGQPVSVQLPGPPS
ncbi:folate-binding protein YgfZ [Glycocaulis abyssi]|uniref:Folate-binding protein YgfZ n=1 Tax=Glycocaulis abyssi TaxID=1433403 RepID=A0ABV9NCC2_9PROT